MSMDSDEMRSDWFGYQCKSGETLFYYNIKTGEHRWANGLSVSEKSIFKISINDLVTKPKDLCSIGTQTEDYGCINGCSSIYADKEIVKHCTMMNSSELNSTMTDIFDSTRSPCYLQEDVSRCLEGNDDVEQESTSNTKMTDSCHLTGSACDLGLPKCIEGKEDEKQESIRSSSETVSCQSPSLSSGNRLDVPNCLEANDDVKQESISVSTINDSCHSRESPCDLQEGLLKCIFGSYDEKQELIRDSDSCYSIESSCLLQEDASKCLEADHDERHQPKSDCIVTDIRQSCTLSSVSEKMILENVEGDVNDVINNCDDQPDAMVIDPNTLTVTSKNGLELRELKKRELLQCTLCDRKFKKQKTHSNHMSKVHDVSMSRSKTFVQDKRCHQTAGARDKEIGRYVKDKYKKRKLKSKPGRKIKITKTTITTDIKKNTRKEKQKHSLTNMKLKGRKNLVNLVESNAKEKPYGCPHCNGVFDFKSYLDIHLRTHTGEKPYECSYCDKAFAGKSNLKLHLRTHTSEKPYECSHCDKAFARKSHLNRHLQTYR